VLKPQQVFTGLVARRGCDKKRVLYAVGRVRPTGQFFRFPF